MFSKPLSFKGRIRRMEYGISLIIYVLLVLIFLLIIKEGSILFNLSFAIMNWFLLAQGAKRCHDIGLSGWFQIIPFFVLWIIFAKGENKMNKYDFNQIG